MLIPLSPETRRAHDEGSRYTLRQLSVAVVRALCNVEQRLARALSTPIAESRADRFPELQISPVPVTMCTQTLVPASVDS